MMNFLLPFTSSFVYILFAIRLVAQGLDMLDQGPSLMFVLVLLLCTFNIYSIFSNVSVDV